MVDMDTTTATSSTPLGRTLDVVLTSVLEGPVALIFRACHVRTVPYDHGPQSLPDRLHITATKPCSTEF